MSAKKITDVLLMKSSFSSRNLTSLALVAILFLVYYLSGGKVVWLPRVESGAGFGSIDQSAQPAARAAVPALTGDVQVAPPQQSSDADKKLNTLEERLKNIGSRK